ncbi:sensor histidine kinase [Indioceanicola profundi]|uniref:sensor histidine kinase n=1 Tax=Indioceanicola profundi TaxID=2220096 RepID=UPI000E6AC4AC|nr:ATP-binding protein [Indioceanicola profundi]
MIRTLCNRSGMHRPRTWHRVLAFGLAAGVFSIDTFTEIEGAIAVLYVLILLLAAPALSRPGLLRLGGACAALALLSYFLAHRLGEDADAVLRCLVSLAAILITTGLLLRNQAARDLLIQANAALHRNERRYRLLFEQAHFALLERDYTRVHAELARLRAEGVTSLAEHARARPGFARRLIAMVETRNVNDAAVQLLGAASRADVLGSTERFLPADHPAMLQVLEALFAGESHYEGRTRVRTADGREISVILGIGFPEDEVGLDQVVVGMVDITRQEQTQEALLAAQAELARAARVATVGALSASIAHELNQPLGALVMNAQTCLRWLRRDPPDIAAAVQAAERTVRDGKRAGEIVQRTRGQLVRGGQAEELLSLGELAEEALLLLERELGAQQIRVTLAFPPDLPLVRGSRVEMQQVLLNLMGNGVQAMGRTDPARRELMLTADRPEAGQVRVSVRDQGTGIAPENLARLFDPFFTTRSEGMGMGLAICRAAVEARGGRLCARNHHDGGAIFEFTLPAAEADVEAL